MLLGKDKLNTMEVLIFKVHILVYVISINNILVLIASYISHDKSVSVNDVLRESNKVKKEI